MNKSTLSINKEELRRLIGLSPDYTISAIVIDNGQINIESERLDPIGFSTRIPGEEYNRILKIIEKSIKANKEIIFSYYNPNKDGIEISSRRFLPIEWINHDCVEGYDLDKKEVRRFCPSRMNWVETFI